MKTQIKNSLMLTAITVAVLFFTSCAKDDVTPGSLLGDGTNFNDGGSGSGYTSQLHNIRFQRQGILDTIAAEDHSFGKVSDIILEHASKRK